MLQISHKEELDFLQVQKFLFLFWLHGQDCHGKILDPPLYFTIAYCIHSISYFHFRDMRKFSLKWNVSKQAKQQHHIQTQPSKKSLLFLNSQRQPLSLATRLAYIVSAWVHFFVTHPPQNLNIPFLFSYSQYRCYYFSLFVYIICPSWSFYMFWLLLSSAAAASERRHGISQVCICTGCHGRVVCFSMHIKYLRIYFTTFKWTDSKVSSFNVTMVQCPSIFYIHMLCFYCISCVRSEDFIVLNQSAFISWNLLFYARYCLFIKQFC